MLRTAGFFAGLNGDDLCCAERDALAVQRTLASSRGVIRDTARAVLARGGQVTRAAVDGFLAWAATTKLDVVVFYVSGHGNRRGFALAGGDFYSFSDLRDWFAYLDNRGTRVIAIFDTCEAGGLVDFFKSGGALEGIDPRALESSWLELIASAGDGVRAYGAVSRKQNAYEAPELGHGRFTAALLHALRGNVGTMSGGVAAFVSDIEAFQTARVALIAKYGRAAAPERVGGRDPIPLVVSDASDSFGDVEMTLAPRGIELDLRVSVTQRRFLPTKLRATFESQAGPTIQQFTDIVLPTYDASVFRRTVRANVLVAAISVGAIYARRFFWRVWAEDERGRQLGEVHGAWFRIPQPRTAPRLVIPAGW